MAGLVDPTKTGKYPVILGESLKGKGAAESVFTAIQYNHKPTLSSPSAPNKARLKPSVPGNTSSYDLNYVDNGMRYTFSGSRETDENKYVLHFDPKRKAFILDKVDSTFNMNATRLPRNAETQHPPIKTTPKPAPEASKPKSARPAPAKSAPSKPAAAKAAPLKPPPKPRAKPVLPKKDPVKRKTEKKAPAQPIALSLPVPGPPKKQEEKAKEKEKSKNSGFEEDDEEDDDDDGGLLVEYPDGDPRTKRQTGFSRSFPAPRRFDDFMNQRESEEDPDSEEMDVIGKDIEFPTFDPPEDQHVQAPVNDFTQREPEPEPMEEDDDLEDDLAKDLEMAFDLEHSQEPTPNDGDESEISEED